MSNSFFPLLAIQDIQIGAVEIKDATTNNRAIVTALGELTVIVAAVGGTVDVNLKEVGGVALTLGQKVMAASIPVVLPSDQDVQVDIKEVGGVALALGQKVKAASIPVTLASDEDDINTNLKEISGVALTLGQKAMAASIPVVLPSDQDVEVVGNVAHDAPDSGNPVKQGLKYNAVLAAVGDGDRVDSQGNKYGQQEIASYDRITKTLATSPANAPPPVISNYFALLAAEVGPAANSVTVDNKMFYEFWHIHLDIVVAGGVGAGTIYLEVKTKNMTQWDPYGSIPVPAAIASYGRGFTIPERVDQIRLRVAGLANVTVDAEAIGGK
jgi:hypothetical protein